MENIYKIAEQIDRMDKQARDERQIMARRRFNRPILEKKLFIRYI